MAPAGDDQHDGQFVISAALDRSQWNGFQKFVLALTALAVIFDGFDNQLIGFAAPALIREWGLSKADLVPVIALSLIAMTIGTAIVGFLGDRIGRRPALIGSVALFGLASMAIAFAPNLATLLTLRLIAALGLGGAMPIATALLAEFTPMRHRSLAVTLGIVCVPLGGLFGGLIAAWILPTMGWRALFAIGGALPLVVTALFLFALPESPQFMLARKGSEGRVRQLLERCGIRVPDGATLVADPVREQHRSGIRALFVDGLAADTLLTWSAFFCCLLAVYSVFNWAPTMLADRGLDLRAASSGLAAFNFGGVAGAVSCGFMIDRFGSRRPMLTLAAAAVLVAVFVLVNPLNAGTSTFHISMIFAVMGFAINGVQTTLFALAATLYPTLARATGVGMALGVGRLGAVLSSAAGAFALSVGGGAYFVLLGVAMAGTFCALAVLRRHTPPAHAVAHAVESR